MWHILGTPQQFWIKSKIELFFFSDCKLARLISPGSWGSWGRKELDMTEQLNNKFHLYTFSVFPAPISPTIDNLRIMGFLFYFHKYFYILTIFPFNLLQIYLFSWVSL